MEKPKGPKVPEWFKEARTGEKAKKRTIEDVRDELYRGVSEYRALFADKRLPDNRSPKDKEYRSNLFAKLNDLAGELNNYNLPEGTTALAITALNQVLMMRDEMNKLEYQNAVLNKKIKDLESGE